MAERIDEIVYQRDEEGSRVRQEPFYDAPAEFLVAMIARELKKSEQWSKVFGSSIDPYMRMDYSIRQLPALRIYNLQYTKEAESWFIVGDIKADIIMPASLRRDETQQLQDTLSGAVVQQFRRPGFFRLLCGLVPGLNELGKVVNVDKSLGFEWETQEVPLTQITLNFRLDLRVWDDYLESTNRTKDSPYVEVLGDLDKLVGQIQGLKDDNATTDVVIGANVNVKG